MNEQYLKRLTKQQKLIILSAICCHLAAKKLLNFSKITASSSFTK